MAKKTKVILLKQVLKLGNKGDIVIVSAGYARNFLIPQRLALIATEKNLGQIEREKNKQKMMTEKDSSLLKPVLEKLHKKGLEFTVLINEGGQLFGTINVSNIEKSLEKEFGLKTDKKTEILVAGESKINIRKMGDYEARIVFNKFPDKPQTSFLIKVKALTK